MSVAVTRKTIFTLVAIGASCWVQAQTYFSGSFNARPFLSCNVPKIEYEVNAGEVKFKIDVGGDTGGSCEQYEPEEITFGFSTMFDSLDKRIDAVESVTESTCCGVPVNHQSKQVISEYKKMRTLLDAARRCALEGDCWNERENDINKLGRFKQAMLDRVVTTSNTLSDGKDDQADTSSDGEDDQANKSLWNENMSLATVCQLLREYNIGEGLIHTMKEKKACSQQKLQEMKDDYWLWRNYESSPYLTIQGVQTELAFARSSSKDSLTGTAKNGYLHERVHESLKKYMEDYLNKRAKRHLISVFDKEEDKNTST